MEAFRMALLEAKLLCVVKQMSQTDRMFSFIGHISVNLDVLYGFAKQNLIGKRFLMVAGVNVPGIGGKFRILSLLRELSFCYHCGPCF